MSTYIMPVDKARRGLQHGQRSSLWPAGHPGVDILPTIPYDRQDVKAAKDGTVTQYVGGSCQGFDWKDDEGKYHRHCHMDPFVSPGQAFKQGQVIAQMAPKGLMFPPGYTHLHWAAATDPQFKNQLDPMKLIGTDPSLASADIPALFHSIWGRPGAKGEIAVFETERRRGVYKDYRNLINTMTYWFQQVYPDGTHLSPPGDAKWQRKKEKVLL